MVLLLCEAMMITMMMMMMMITTSREIYFLALFNAGRTNKISFAFTCERVNEKSLGLAAKKCPRGIRHAFLSRRQNTEGGEEFPNSLRLRLRLKQCQPCLVVSVVVVVVVLTCENGHKDELRAFA